MNITTLDEALAEIARLEKSQSMLVEAGKALSSERSLDGVLQRIVELAVELTGAKYGALGVLAPGKRKLSRFVTIGIDEETRAQIGELPKGRGILGVLIDDPKPLRMKRLQDDPRSVGFPAHHPPMESFLGVPIVTANAVAGRIYLTEKQGAKEFSAEDERLAEILASQAAIAIDNAELNDRLLKTAAQLTEANRHKSVFLANMSHELRSPLNTIIGYVRLLLDDREKLDEEQAEDLEIVRSSSEHLLALITDLLDVQRIESGHLQLEPVEVDLRTIAKSSIASIRPILASDVELVTDFAGIRDPILTVDQTRIRQVFLNILGNAAKFTSEGAITLRLSDKPDSETIIIEITDTGDGIATADQERIFESFYQSQSAISRTPGPSEGAGLGLAITKMLVELHNGEITLESNPGQGTRIIVRIPRHLHVT